MRNIKNTKKKKKMPKKKRSVNFKPPLGSSKKNISKSSIRKQINTLDTIVEDSLKELENININKDRDDYTKGDSNAIDTEAEIKTKHTIATNESKEHRSSTKEKHNTLRVLTWGINKKATSMMSPIQSHPPFHPKSKFTLASKLLCI